ncbi:unnamed protein product, partial [Iphiclides podalirius]
MLGDAQRADAQRAERRSAPPDPPDAPSARRRPLPAGARHLTKHRSALLCTHDILYSTVPSLFSDDLSVV